MKKYIIPTLGVWDSFEEIDFASLPDKFVLKTTNGGGSSGVVICTDKATFLISEQPRKNLKNLWLMIFIRLWENGHIKMCQNVFLRKNS